MLSFAFAIDSDDESDSFVSATPSTVTSSDAVLPAPIACAATHRQFNTQQTPALDMTKPKALMLASISEVRNGIAPQNSAMAKWDHFIIAPHTLNTLLRNPLCHSLWEQFKRFAKNKSVTLQVHSLTVDEVNALKDLPYRFDLNLRSCGIVLATRLNQLQHINKLIISWSPIRHFDVVNFTHLESFAVKSCSALRELNIRLSPSLQELVIGDCERLQSIKGTEHLTNLTTLEVRALSMPQHFQDMAVFANLNTLKLLRCDTGENLCHIADLLNLRTLEVEDSDTLHSLCGIENLTDLERVTVMRCKNLVDLGDMSGLNKLHTLLVQSCNGLSNLTLEDVQGLKHLKIFVCQNLVGLTIRNLPSLQKLEIPACVRMHGVILEHLPNLTKLMATSFRFVEDLSQFSGLLGLEHLEICVFDNLMSLHGIEALQKLQSVIVLFCNALENITPLLQLPRLVEAKIDNCVLVPQAQIDALKTHLEERQQAE